MGEISFCAYNTGVGFRQIIEKMKRTATVAEWYKTRGRHPIYAKNQHLPLSSEPLSVVVRPFGGASGANTDAAPGSASDGRRRLRLVS